MGIFWGWVIMIAVVIYVLAAVKDRDKRHSAQRRMENKLLEQACEIDELKLKLLGKEQGAAAVAKKLADDQRAVVRGGWAALDRSWKNKG